MDFGSKKMMGLPCHHIHQTIISNSIGEGLRLSALPISSRGSHSKQLNNKFHNNQRDVIAWLGKQ
jgi:hypothetical protein